MKIDLYFVVIPILICVFYYLRNEEKIDKFDSEMNEFLLNNSDKEILSKLSKERLAINKVIILVNEFYKTNNPQLLAFALREFYLKVLLLLAVAIGITFAIIAFLLKYLFL